MGLREQRRLEKEERIRDAAEALFREKGFEATTTREIAERAEVAVGTLFLYAKSKEEVLLLVWRERIGDVVEAAFGSLPQGPLLERLLFLFGAFLDFYAQDQALARIYVRELLFPGSESESATFTLAFLQRLQWILQQAEEAGELQAELPLPLLSANLFGSYVLMLVGWLNGNVPEEQLRPLLLASLELQLRGLLSPGVSR